MTVSLLWQRINKQVKQKGAILSKFTLDLMARGTKNLMDFENPMNRKKAEDLIISTMSNKTVY